MQIGVLGPLEVHDGATPIEVSGARLRLLLAVLAVEVPRAVSPASLVDALWQDEPPTDQTNALQSLVSRLRKALGDPDLIQATPAGYRLAVTPDDVDAYRFEELARAGRAALRSGDFPAARQQLTDALGLWRGEPVELAQSGYVDATLARWEELRLDALADRIEATIGLDGSTVIAELEGLVAAYPLRERFAALLVRALHSAGRQSEALDRYEKTRATLADELGADPSAELQAAHLAALQSPPTASEPATRRSNLRATLTSFVGRDEQLVQIGNLLATGRLITLVGPGGAGKTRLAGAAAAIATDAAADGVWMAELAPVTDPADVPQAVLGSLGLRDAILLDRSTMTPRDATTRLIDALAPWTAVLVLDNCEHLIDAAAQLADQLLAHCPQLRIVATSREPLGIFGEALVVVPPLGQPEPAAGAKEALKFPAVQLFADRATDVQPEFVVDDDTVGSVIEIVRRLDGLPLAIELAAARLRSLPVTEVERRLSDRFRLLTGGSRTAMPRHRTLRAVVEWSWDLLSDAERTVAERLAVFSGGVTPTAAAAVCADTDLGDEHIDDVLASLVDKSLLQAVASVDSAPRYRMLETIREFGMERLGDRGEVAAVRLAHAEFFEQLVADADPHLRQAEQLEWMAILRIERENILSALKFFGDDGRAQSAVDLVNLLGWYWMTIGDHSEIVTWVSFALDADGKVAEWDRLMAETFLAMNTFAWSERSNHDEVQAGLDRLTAASAEMANSATGTPPMMTLLAPVVAMFVGQEELAERLIERALADDDPWIAAATRMFRASLAENVGDVTMMREDATTALAAFRELGERWGMANSLQVLGQLELMEGHLEAAAAAYQEGLDLATAIGGREDIAMMRLRLADILTRLGDMTGAQEHARLGQEAAAQSGSPIEVLFTHLVQVEIARNAGQAELAAELRDEAIVRLRALPEVHPIHGHGLAVVLSSAAKIDLDCGDVAAARERLDEAYEHALRSRDMPIVATVGVTVALAANHLGQPANSAEILGAAAQLRGADDWTQVDIAALDVSLGGLTNGTYAADYRRGRELDREQALARVKPSVLG